jgi:hypothetical protein
VRKAGTWVALADRCVIDSPSTCHPTPQVCGRVMQRILRHASERSATEPRS